MAWLILGALFLLLAVRGGGGKAPRLDPLGLAALACLAAAAWWSLRVYPAARAAPMLVALPLALFLLLPAKGLGPPLAARCIALALGTAASLFALFGPADGLFPS
jgi:hypothetical protein